MIGNDMIIVANYCLIKPKRRGHETYSYTFSYSTAAKQKKKKLINAVPCGHMTWHPCKLLIAESIWIVQKLMYRNLSFNSHTRLLISSKSSESGIPFKSFFFSTLSVKLQPELLKDFV